MRNRLSWPPPHDPEPEGGATLVMDDAVTTTAGHEARARPLPRLGFGHEEVRRESATALAIGAFLTLLWLMGVAIATGPALRWAESRATADHGHENERIVYLDVRAPEPAMESATEPARAAPAVTAPTNVTSTRQPPAASPRDTTPGGGTGAPRGPGDARAVPLGALPSPARLGGAIGAAAGTGAARSGCAAPCREAAVAGYAPGTELARRDSVLREKMQEVVDRAGPAQKPPGFQIGLPGGGPTKEERQRDSTLHAEYRKRLAALLARYDSLKADSIARGLIREPPNDELTN